MSIEVELPDGRTVEVDTDDPAVAARAAATFMRGAGQGPAGRGVAEFLGREIGSVAGAVGGAVMQGGQQALSAVTNLDPMAMLKAVPQAVQGGIAGEQAGREEGRRQGGAIYDKFVRDALAVASQRAGRPLQPHEFRR